MNNEYILEVNHVGKDFLGDKVLGDANIKVKPGEIVALIGENGAGKSAIMNIPFGMPVIQQTGGLEGSVLVNGKEVSIRSPIEAMRYGVGMVHQESMLIDGCNVAENIKPNGESVKKTPISLVFGKRLDLVNRVSIHKESRATLNSLGVELSDKTRVGSLPVRYKQFVEVAREPDEKSTKPVVLGEPTAMLTRTEAGQFLVRIRSVTRQGVTFISISHKLDGVKNNTHHVFILRDGETVGDYHMAGLSTVRILWLMVGHEIEILNRETDHEEENGGVYLEFNHLRVDMSGEIVRDMTFQVRKDKVFRIEGLADRGKISIASGVIGLYPSKGEVRVHGRVLDMTKTKDTLDDGITFVSEGRRGVGLMPDESIELNIAVATLKTKDRFVVKKFGIPFYDKRDAVEYAREIIKDLGIRYTGHTQPIEDLSGGNQQKACITGALTLEPDIPFVSGPTRGTNIGVKKMVLDSLMKLNKEKGIMAVITSSELAELRSVCNRIAIVTEGKVAEILRSDDKGYKFGLLIGGSGLEDIDGETM